jgi:uncharacterized protein YodC (DUF2158 family)
MSQPFAPGDVVMLNSGGPQMTVVHTTATEVHVIWFDKNSKREDSFPLSAISKYDVMDMFGGSPST